MKKAAITILMVCVLAGGAFAQITFSGSAYAGIQVRNADGEDASVDTLHREEGPSRFDVTATVMRENYGARLDTTFWFVDDPDQHFTLNGIYAWVHFDGFMANDAVRLTMGHMSSTPWVLTRFHNFYDEQEFGNVRGFRLEYTTPIQGLSVGTAVRAQGGDLEWSGERLVFGATYIHPLFSTLFAYDFSGNGQTIFSFNFTGIPDVTAAFQLHAWELASWGDDPVFFGRLHMRQMLGYRIMRPLFVYMIFGQRFQGADNSDVGLEFIPGVVYNILPNVTGSFSMVIESPDHFSTTNLILNPMLEHTLRGPASLYLEYALDIRDVGGANHTTHTLGFGITIRAF